MRRDNIQMMSVAVAADQWQARLDRMRRVLPLPLLLVSTVVALCVAAASHDWSRLPVGLPLASAAAVLWAVVTVRPDVDVRWPRAVFALQSALAAVLVWVSPAYGIFGYIGFLYAYGLGPRWRIAGFAVTALVVSAAMAGGYPSGDPVQTATFVLVAVVLMALVLNSASITSRAVEQNQERGRIIDALAEANRRLENSMAENAELHARLVEQAREAGVVEERQRLAGEIHDTLAQGLTGIIAQLQAAEQTRHRPDEWSRHLDLARTLARSSLTEARRSVRALRPEQLDDASLDEAIGTLASAWSERSAVPAEVDTIGTPTRAGADVEAAVFRVAQEALTNVGKHARAGRVRLTLTYLDDALLLDVADDGVGFDPAGPRDGYGLLGMQQRLDRVHGTLTVESAVGGGTTVNAAVPFDGAGR